MTDSSDEVGRMRDRLAVLYPDLDTSAFGVTGRVLRLAQQFDRLRTDHLATFELTPGDFDVLATIRRLEGREKINPARLLQSVLITSGGLTKRLDRLEEAGLIARYRDPQDRRGALLRLTPDGTALVSTARCRRCSRWSVNSWPSHSAIVSSSRPRRCCGGSPYRSAATDG